MEKINAYSSATIGAIVAEDYRKAEVFKKYGLDFCCGGGKSVETACQEKNLSIEELIRDLEAKDDGIIETSDSFNTMDLDLLVDHILKTHHVYVSENIPLIREFSQKVAKVHGAASPEVIEIDRIFNNLGEELGMHMHKEEFMLFPFIIKIAESDRLGYPLPAPQFGSIANPVNMMEHEHVNAGDAIEKIKTLSNNYSPPEYACTTYRVLYAKLKEFEEDLNRHIHLENNILFPRAKQMERLTFS
jgi:regulator of cell morphogenesis and NO signaling